MIEDEYFLL